LTERKSLSLAVFFALSSVPVFSILFASCGLVCWRCNAPHEVVIPIEFVRRYPDGREEPAEVEVTVSRVTNWKDERVLTRQLANGKMTLKVPTLPHDFRTPSAKLFRPPSVGGP